MVPVAGLVKPVGDGTAADFYAGVRFQPQGQVAGYGVEGHRKRGEIEGVFLRKRLADRVDRRGAQRVGVENDLRNVANRELAQGAVALHDAAANVVPLVRDVQTVGWIA